MINKLATLAQAAAQVLTMAGWGEIEGGETALKGLAESLVSLVSDDLLEEAGYRIEGPGRCEDDGPEDRYWWTVYRDGWSGVEASNGDFDSEEHARGDAVRAFLVDEDFEQVWLPALESSFQGAAQTVMEPAGQAC